MTYIPSAPRFLNPSAPLKAALSSLNGYDQHTRAMEAIKAPLTAARTERQDAESTAALIAATLGDHLLTAPAADAAEEIETSSRQAAQAADAEFTAAARVKLLEATEQRIGAELDRIILSSRDKLLRHLDGTLKDAYRKSWALGLHGIHDAEAAINAGKADDWRTMLELRTIVFQIRDAQSLIAGRLGGHEHIQRVKTFGTLANYAELWPGWLEGANGQQWGRQDTTAPWPTTNGEADPAELHAWILENPQAEPWVPTEAELLAAVKEATAEARAAAHAAHVGQDA